MLLLCICAAGQTLAASYPAAIESLPPAAEDLRSRLGGLGGAGEVGLQSLAKVAAGELAGVLYGLCLAAGLCIIISGLVMTAYVACLPVMISTRSCCTRA